MCFHRSSEFTDVKSLKISVEDRHDHLETIVVEMTHYRPNEHSMRTTRYDILTHDADVEIDPNMYLYPCTLPVAPTCVHCDEPCVDFIDTNGNGWHRTCHDEWTNEYNAYCDQHSDDVPYAKIIPSPLQP